MFFKKNNNSHGNSHSYGNNCSDGNNWSDGNNFSDGNNWSDGNNFSHGNNRSHGNNHSNGNNFSYGNNNSHGNNWSDGNNLSYLNSKVLGSHQSIFCHDLKGICFMAFNQQADEEKIQELLEKLSEILQGWIPYVTDYPTRKADGWHKKHDNKNGYVSPIAEDDDTHEKLYHEAWARCPKDKVEAIIRLIRDTKWLKTKEALKTFEKVTGISADGSLSGKTVKVSLDGKEYEAIIK